MQLKWAEPKPADEIIGWQGKRITELEAERDALCGELVALKAAARPVVKWLEHGDISELCGPFVFDDGEKILKIFATSAQLDKLAALVGEEGK